jgi:hypothetical protein
MGKKAVTELASIPGLNEKKSEGVPPVGKSAQ